MDTKFCSKCKEEKPLEEFGRQKRNKDGRRYVCKVCRSIESRKEREKLKNDPVRYKQKQERDTAYRIANYEEIKKRKTKWNKKNKKRISEVNRRYQEANKEKIAEKSREYREDNREKISERDRKYREANKEKIAKGRRKHYEENKEKVLASNRLYREANKEKLAECQREYREANKEKLAEWQRKHYQKNPKKKKAYNNLHKEKFQKIQYARHKKNLELDPSYKLRHYLRNRLRKVICRNQKNGSAVRDLGCSVEELKKHLESQFNSRMNWNKWGEYWQIDHIYPLTAANLEDRVEFLAVNNWRNLQPLACEENSKKSNKVTPAAQKLFDSLCGEFA